MRTALVVLILIIAGAINFFAVKFGAEDSRPLVRNVSVASGSLAIICAIATPGAFLRFLLSGDSLALTNSFILGAICFTAISFIMSVIVAIKLSRTAA